MVLTDNQELMVERQAIRDWMRADLQVYPDSSALDLAYEYAYTFRLLRAEGTDMESVVPQYLMEIAKSVLEEVGST